MKGRPLRVFLVASEASADLMGSRLMAALVRTAGRPVEFAGVGGERMREAGLSSLFPISELSVMGLMEILPRLAAIRRHIRATAAAARAFRPDIMVTIDGWAFMSRVAARLTDRSFPIVQFVAPKVWAWGERRAATVARLADHVLAQFPFEPPFFEPYGVGVTVVGHPVVEGLTGRGDGPGFRLRHTIDPQRPILVVLPGSRPAEVGALAPVFRKVVERAAMALPSLRVVVPTVETVEARVATLVRDWPGEPVVVTGELERFGAFAAAHAAIAASGTVALELALSRVPNVIAYRMNAASAFVARRLVRVRYANLVNILLDRLAVPECIQEACDADHVWRALQPLLSEGEARRSQLDAFAEVAQLLGYAGAPPSDRAARAVLEIAARGRSQATKAR